MTGLIPIARYTRGKFVAVLNCGHQRWYEGMSAGELEAYCLECWTGRTIVRTIFMDDRPDAA